VQTSCCKNRSQKNLVRQSCFFEFILIMRRWMVIPGNAKLGHLLFKIQLLKTGIFVLDLRTALLPCADVR